MIIRIIDYSLLAFHTNIFFHWKLSDTKSLQVSKTLLSTVAVFKNAVVSVIPLICNSSSFLTKHLGTVSSAPTTIGITVTLTLHSFFLILWQGPSICLSFRFFIFTLSSVRKDCMRVFSTSFNWRFLTEV